MTEKTILVTGGAGFMGSNFVHYILDKYPDYRVMVIDALTYAGSLDHLPKEASSTDQSRLVFWYGNINNAGLMDTLIAQSDMVVHFAAETHVTRSIHDNLLFFQTDVLGTQTVANSVLKNRDRIERFVHVSTSEVYGTARTARMDEDHPLLPMSPYASAKCGADRLVYSYWATYRLPAVIVRPFNNYGPRQHLEKVIPRFITSILLDEPLVIHGDGLAARDFIHVDDTCRAVDALLHAEASAVVGEVFNVATGVHRSILDLADAICRHMGAETVDRVHVGNRPGQVFRHTGDAGKIGRALGWAPETDWDAGLRQTIDWFKDNPELWRAQQWMRYIPIRTSNGKLEMH